MIENDLQYRITKEELENFERALLHYKAEESTLVPRLVQAMKEAFESTIEELQEKLAEYEAKQHNTATA